MTMMQMPASYGPAVYLTFVTSVTATTADITIPATAAVGDIAILFDRAVSSTVTAPTGVTPTGWTLQNTASQSVTTPGNTIRSSWKLLVDGDPGLQITGMTGSAATSPQNKVMLIFRPNIPVTDVIAGGGKTQATAATPTNQVLGLLGNPQYRGSFLALAHWGASAAITTRGLTGITTTEVAGASTQQYVKYAVLNPSSAALTNGTQSTTDVGSNGMECFWLQAFASTGQYPLLYYNAEAFTGWTQAGTTSLVTTNGTSGMTAFGINAAGGSYAYINTGLSLLNKTIFVDMYPAGNNTNALIDFFFGCNSAGLGYYFRIDTRTSLGSYGWGTTTNWTTWSAGTTAGANGTPNTWYTVKITISAAGVANAYVNGTQSSTANFSVTPQGGYIGCIGDNGGGGTNLFDNIMIFDGVI